MKERLQKILARAGYGSRRSCEAIIADRRVTVNKRTATLGMKADIDHDRIEVDGRPIKPESPIYIKLNKPVGVLSSTTDELNQGRTTILDLVDLDQHLYPVGRLDKQSQGLMLLTNNGALTHRLTHPRYEHHKVYRVSVEGKISEEDIDRWREGVRLDGKETAPAQIEVLSINDTSTWLQITLREGRKRQIRRIAARLGHPVESLIRESIGPIKLDDLKTGEWRYLTDEEISQLANI